MAQVLTNTLEHQWIPFTVNRQFKEEPRLMAKAEGMYYWNHRGDKIIDAASGMFCCAAGHGRKEIAEAVHTQLMEMDYATSFNLGHPIAFEFASRVAALTPGELNRVFFANSGSEAVDTAMKIALAYSSAKGEGQRVRFVSRERAYHGVNFGGTALSGLVKNRDVYGTGLPGVVHMRHTHLPEHKYIKGQPETGAEMAEDLLRFVQLYGGDTIAACFVEPVAGSTGWLVPPKRYLNRLREICDDHNILLVFDEVICGFGRTGKAFAAQTFDVTPDMITMAKALTNGAQPMSAIAVRDEIYETVVNAAPENAIELFHGYTYSAHPAACAAGIASLDIYRDDQLFERGEEMSPYFMDSMIDLQDIPIVDNIRAQGMMAGIDLAPDVRPGLRGFDAQVKLFDAGLHLKATGDCALVAPALIAEKGHIDEISGVLREVLETY
ncbi:MAG: aspartate aminotransferase family protein [Alphaproteobacteria bacterium]|nr:aspartate aminotransferase family protein [Alphaproteobacteria bacterium]|tara:strand:- start:6617 stop:7930 length:1314 start_codon:yes stop_codon:yes gene_type:complete